MDVDWDALRCRAHELTKRAYVPYSHFPVGAAGLAEDGRLHAGRVLEAGDEGAGVEKRPARGLPPLVLVQAVEVGTELELGERAREVHVREDAARLLGLVGAADLARRYTA